jgi:hypothetical protein
MWNKIRSSVIWLHQAEHVARFQQYFGVVPAVNQQLNIVQTMDDKTSTTNNHINSNTSAIDDDKTHPVNDVYRRHSEQKLPHDSNVLDECMDELRHNINQHEFKDKKDTNPDYRISSWFWYYFFQFGAALGNEIFYILFFPTW